MDTALVWFDHSVDYGIAFSVDYCRPICST